MFRGLLRLGGAFVIILIFLAAGNLVVRLTGMPMPGSIIGMLLLVAGLRFRLLRPRHVVPAASLLLRHMALFFVPPAVGMMLYFDVLADDLGAIVAATIVSTLAVMLTVGFVEQKADADD